MKRLRRYAGPPLGPSFANLLWGLVLACRPYVSAVAGLVVCAVYVSWATEEVRPALALGVLVVAFLSSAFGFVLNDAVDSTKDRLPERKLAILRGHPARPVVRGLVSRREAFAFAVVLGLLSLALSSLLPGLFVVINALLLVLLCLYSPVNNGNGIAANIVYAFSMGLLFLLGMAASGQLRPEPLGLAVATFCLIWGREILLDFRDRKEDRDFGKDSVPIRYGQTASFRLAAILFLLTAVTSAVVAVLSGNLSLLSGLLVFNTLVWFYFLPLWKEPNSERRLSAFLMSTRVAFLAVILGVFLQ